MNDLQDLLLDAAKVEQSLREKLTSAESLVRINAAALSDVNSQLDAARAELAQVKHERDAMLEQLAVERKGESHAK